MANDKQLIPGAFYWVIPEIVSERMGTGSGMAGRDAAGALPRMERRRRDDVELHGIRRLVGLADDMDRRGDRGADRPGAVPDAKARGCGQKMSIAGLISGRIQAELKKPPRGRLFMRIYQSGGFRKPAFLRVLEYQLFIDLSVEVGNALNQFFDLHIAVDGL